MHIDFANGMSAAEWAIFNGTLLTEGLNLKNENSTPISDVLDWRFMLIDNGALTHVPGTGPAGSGAVSPLSLEFLTPNLVFQVGIGASMKQPNDILGASAWIVNTNPVQGVQWTGGFPDHGDINIVLEAAPTPTVEIIPLPSALLSGASMIVVMGMGYCVRRRA